MPSQKSNLIYLAGIDVGSIAAKAVVYELTEKKIIASAVYPTGWTPKESAYSALELACKEGNITIADIKYSMATGYGRVSLPFVDEVKTEISCHAKAATYLHPNAGLVLDIGGQDSKVISIDKDGNVSDFMMNDKCAAGTGRFMQVIAGILGLSLEELGNAAAKGTPANISSMCAVFAESEIIGLLAKGVNQEDLAAGVFTSIAKRMRSLSGRISWQGQCIFTGGLATNPNFAKHLADVLEIDVQVPENPQCMGALGAALFAGQAYRKKLKANT